MYAGPGSRGPHVLAVQHALGFRPASGYYGPMTRAALAKLTGRPLGPGAVANLQNPLMDLHDVWVNHQDLFQFRHGLIHQAITGDPAVRRLHTDNAA